MNPAIPATYKQRAAVHEGVQTLSLLKRMAGKYALYNFIAAILFLGLYLYASIDNFLAVFAGYVEIAVCLVPLIVMIWNRHFKVVFSGLALFNLAPIWFLLLESVLPGYDASTYITPYYRMLPLFWIAIFQFSANAAYFLLADRGFRFSAQKFSFLRVIRFDPMSYVYFTFIAFFGPLIAFTLYYGSFATLWGIMSSGRADGGAGGLLQRESTGDAGSYMLPLTWIFQLTPLFASIAMVSVPKKAKPLGYISLVLGLAAIFVFFLSGSRGTMIFVAAPAIFFLFYYNWHKGWKFWIPAGIMLVLLIAIMELQVRFRGNLLMVIADPERAARIEGLRSATTFDPSESHRDNNMYLFCLMVKNIPSKTAFEGFNDLAACLLNPVPRAIWPSKPVLYGAQDLSNQASFVTDGPLIMGTTSLSFSIVGDAYKANGFLGILFYAVTYSLFLIFFDGIIYYSQDKNPLTVGLQGIGIFLSFWGYRALIALVTFLYPVLSLILLLYFLKYFKQR